MTAGDKILVSVIIPTRNRRGLLEDLMKSLATQTLAPESFEVIVVDNCSTDGTPEMMSRFQQELPFSLVYEHVSENRGQIRSRNVGANLARAEIMAFTDSDCRVTPAWLEKGLAAIQQSSDIGFVTGPVRDKPEQPVTFFSQPTFANFGENETYPACNIFYRKKAFLELKGFDESAWPGDIGDKSFGDSDTDLAWRVKQAGYANRFVEDMVVYHEVWSLNFKQWVKAQALASRIPGVFKKSPQIRKKFMWWGPFLCRETFFFYLAVIGLVLILTRHWWAFALLLPHLWSCLRSPGTRFSLVRIPRITGRLAGLTLRQGLLCGALIWGSVRAKVVVL